MNEIQLIECPLQLIAGLAYVFFFFKEDFRILLIKNYEHKVLTSQSIKFCKIIATCYEVT
jgi:hypothetical protein